MAEKAVFGIAKRESQAISIADNLKASGFTDNDISVLFPDKQGTKDFAHEQHTKAPEGATTGAGRGAILGGALRWMVGIGALAIPGLGPFIRRGSHHGGAGGRGRRRRGRRPHRRAYRYGYSRIRGQAYEGKVKDGNILMSVHTDDSKERELANEIFVKGGAKDISYTGEA